MAFSVEMPALGESVSEGTVTRWLKKEGDTVEVDEPLLEVSTDKVDTEIPSPAAGTLTKIIAEEDETIEIGGELAVIDDGSGGSEDSSSDSDSAEPADSAEDEPADDSGSEESGSDDSDSGDSASDSSSQAPSSGSAEGTDVVMPELGESVTEGTITSWLKAVGDTVEVDEPLLEVSTDKVDTEIPSPAAGTLLEIVAQEDETVEIGDKLAVIGDGSAPAPKKDSGGSSESSEKSEPEPEPEPEPEKKPEPEPEPEPEKKPEPKAEKKQAPASEAPASDPSGPASDEPAKSGEVAAPAEPGHRAKGGTPYVTPLVRKLAEENDVDLSTVTGSGIGGRIRKQDVLAAASGESAAPSDESSAPAKAKGGPSSKGVRPELAELRGTTKKANRIRQITARTTRESLQKTAQLTQVHEVDMTRVAALRDDVKESFQDTHGVKLTYLPFYCKAVVEALVSHPNVNASYDEDSNEITYHQSVNLGIAVDTPEGLLSPVIKDAQDLDIPGLAKAIADLAGRARDKKLRPDDLSGGTFTVTNIGSEGALFDTPILVPPQAAMLGTGAIVRRAVVESDDFDGEAIAIRSMGYLPLTYDHRLVDGADAGRFVTTVRDRLETAQFEADLGL